MVQRRGDGNKIGGLTPPPLVTSEKVGRGRGSAVRGGVAWASYLHEGEAAMSGGGEEDGRRPEGRSGRNKDWRKRKKERRKERWKEKKERKKEKERSKDRDGRREARKERRKKEGKYEIIKERKTGGNKE